MLSSSAERNFFIDRSAIETKEFDRKEFDREGRVQAAATYDVLTLQAAANAPHLGVPMRQYFLVPVSELCTIERIFPRILTGGECMS